MIAFRNSPSFTQVSLPQGETRSIMETEVSKRDRESIIYLFFKIHLSPLSLHSRTHSLSVRVCACERGAKLGNPSFVHTSSVCNAVYTRIKIHPLVKFHPSRRWLPSRSRAAVVLVAWVLPTIPIGIGTRETSHPLLIFLFFLFSVVVAASAFSFRSSSQ